MDINPGDPARSGIDAGIDTHASTAMMVRAGCVLLVRAHGVIAAPSHTLPAPVTVPGLRLTYLEVGVTPDQHLPIHFPSANAYAIAGGGSFTRKGLALRETDPEGSWLRVVVARDYPIPADAAARFAATHDVGELDDLLGSSIRADLLGPALVAAGQVAAGYAVAEPHLRVIGAAYWWGPGAADHGIAVNLTVGMHVVPRHPASVQQTVALFARAAATISEHARADQDALGSLAVASHWLLTAADLPHRSNERFLLFFQALEALAQLAPRPEPPPNQVAAADLFDRLRVLATEHGGEQAAVLDDLLRRKKGAMLGRSLGERFSDLARAFRPATAAEDTAAFDAMNRLRNDLVHGKSVEIPSTFRGYPVQQTVQDLAFAYLAQVGDAALAAGAVLVTTGQPVRATPGTARDANLKAVVKTAGAPSGA